MFQPVLSSAALIVLITATTSSPARAKERCNPPHAKCGLAPIIYECPPCPPGGIQLAQPGKLEAYRRSLESYREGVEIDRSDNPGGSLLGYDKAIKKYQDGISTYKDAIDVTIGEPK